MSVIEHNSPNKYFQQQTGFLDSTDKKRKTTFQELEIRKHSEKEAFRKGIV